MASSWGTSWGSAWGDSWGSIGTTPPIPEPEPTPPGAVVPGSRHRYILPDGTRIVGYAVEPEPDE